MICGLYMPDYHGISGMEALSKLADETWVMNDWYQFTPWLNRPARIWNIHAAPHTHISDPSRFPWDWKEWYRKSIANGARVIVTELIEGIDIRCQELLDMEGLLRDCIDYALGCQAAIMICQAAREGFKRINVIGARFHENEYVAHIQAMMHAIVFARSKGVEVILPEGREGEWALSRFSDAKSMDPYWLESKKNSEQLKVKVTA